MGPRDLLLDAFGRIGEEVEQVVEGLTAEGLSHQPDAGSNSVGWLIWHLTRVEDDHVSEIADRPQAYVEDGWAAKLGMRPDTGDTGYGHTPEQVAAVRFDGPDQLLRYHRAVATRTADYLTTLDTDEPDRIIDDRWDPPVTVGVRLVSVIGDCLQHVGQAAYLRGLYERSSTQPR